MTASVFVFVPVALLALVAVFYFVGCVFHTEGIPGPPFTTYSNTDVIGNPSCVAYWPLSDSPGQDTALDVVGTAKGNPHNGTYFSVASKDPAVQNLFPCPAFTLDPSGPVDSAFAPGTLTIGAPGIVLGDAVQPLNNPAAITTAMQCNGGFVSVPVNSVVNQASAFTIEFWARPEWDAMAAPAFRAVIDSRSQGGGLFFGFAIWVNEDGNWQAQLGATGNGNFIEVTAGPAPLSAATHVVLTFDGTSGVAALFINGTQASPSVPLPPGTSFAPNTTAPLVIGVGTPYLPPRTQPSDNNFFPLLPFNGTIQDVAIYSEVLNDEVINIHALNGQGTDAG